LGQCFAKAESLLLCPSSHPAEQRTLVDAARLEMWAMLAQVDLQTHDQRQQNRQKA
jgi:hypothetical protein